MSAPTPARAEAVTRRLLGRAHSPASVDRLYTEKIQHRPLRLRASSPPPVAAAREARRIARQHKARDRKKQLKPRPLSARERRRLGLYRLPAAAGACSYAALEPLHRLWLGYIREVLGSDIWSAGGSPAAAAAKLTSADFHGALVEVVRSSCPSRVGIKGIVAKDSKFIFEVVTEKNAVKMVPKEGTVFRVQVPVAAAAASPETDGDGTKTTVHELEKPSEAASKQDDHFVFEIHGEQFQLRSIDRANKKFKAHFLPNL